MSTSSGVDSTKLGTVASRVLSEGYGPGAWHGADLKAALADVDAALAYWRPAAGRHNIAEIALHHAWYVRGLREKLSGEPAGAFVVSGEDWFPVDDAATLAWPAILDTVASEQQQLAAVVTAIEAGARPSAVADDERLGLVLGITCHAVYHAGQVQLIKRLHGG